MNTWLNTWPHTGLSAWLKSAGLGLLALALAACSDSGSYDPPGDAAEGAPPVVNLVSIGSSSGGGTATWNTDTRQGDVVTLTVETSEAILAPTVLLAGEPAQQLRGSGSRWTASRTMELTDAEGQVPFSLRVRDRDGAVQNAAAITETTDGSQVMFSRPQVHGLVWQDEFDGASLDAASWNIQTGDGTAEGLPAGWGNNELQTYAATQISVGGGYLNLIANEATGGGYTSARINTRGKRDFRPTAENPVIRVVARARLPQGKGIWPAIWMLPTDYAYGPWPQSGEIDIVEATNLGVMDKKTISSTIHYGFPWPDNSFNSQSFTPTAVPQDGFHEYMMEWDADGEIRFYFDGMHYATQTADNYFAVTGDGIATPYANASGAAAPFDQNFHLLLNVAVGGNLPGMAPDTTNTWPQPMQVDWVRVYRCVDASAEDLCTTPKNPDVSPVRGADVADIYEPLLLYDGNAADVNPLTVTVRGTEYTDQPTVNGFDSQNNALTNGGVAGHTLANNRNAMDPTDSSNTVWRFQVSGGVANTFISSQSFGSTGVLATGFDLRGSDAGGRLLFDMYVDTLSDGTSLVAKLDSGFPNLCEVTVPGIAMDAWKTYSIPIRDCVASPRAGGGGRSCQCRQPFRHGDGKCNRDEHQRRHLSG